ncbi:MAG: class I SAM-dependent methyltransferase [Bilifractor sp.]
MMGKSLAEAAIQSGTAIGEIEDYWKYRSESYSDLNIEELNSWKRNAWAKLILHYAPARTFMKVLDIGTGPGFFAINLALRGYDVTAVDVTPEMLDCARDNADAYGASVRFLHQRGEKLDFPDESFDLIVNRNVTWNLEYPLHALAEWRRVLKKGGRMIYFDANWYKYLFDQEAAEQSAQDSRNLKEQFPLYYEHVQRDILFEQDRMEEIARTLPLSNVERPQWDRKVLTGLGMSKIVIAPSINERIYDEQEQVRYHSIPMFMVCAEK